ncbi:Hypothetical_protein [Hexamita inflata]|uniref:Hypothetical_protein n=1 Tax=Hexamita inflata TaxID=28002 RepID=A0AA86RBN4_9EUKA|nr:Hypothetical protein HINF_LOCUS60867 [Hexamita inflata]
MGFIDAFIHCWHYFCQVRSGNTDKLNIISFQQNQQHKINLSTQLIFDRILTKTVVQLSNMYLKQEEKQEQPISSSQSFQQELKHNKSIQQMYVVQSEKRVYKKPETKWRIQEMK